MSAAFIAVDWGTTNRRSYAIAADGTVIDTVRDARGLLAIAPGGFPAEAAAIRARLGDLPMLCAGMVGSVRSWADVPYQRCPADLDTLAAHLQWVEPGRTAIVPGLACVGGGSGDVMRGEEVQILGSVAAGLVPADALVCQPGTHCKWASLRGDRIDRFRTTMTGELFALLKAHSLLADFLGGEVGDGAAFRDGVAVARAGMPLGALFGARADALLDLRPRDDIAAFVSGILIGQDVVEQRLAPGACVHILADPAFGSLYTVAIEANGGTSRHVDSHAAFAAGITAIWSLSDASSS